MTQISVYVNLVKGSYRNTGRIQNVFKKIFGSQVGSFINFLHLYEKSVPDIMVRHMTTRTVFESFSRKDVCILMS